jgi:hypothetical protein
MIATTEHIEVAQIPLSCGGFATISVQDQPVIDAWRWSWTIDSRGYVASRKSVDGRQKWVRLHSLLCGASRDVMVDHRDGNKLNNTRSNLRYATNSQNQANRGPTKHSSPFKGVHVQPKTGRAEARVVCRGVHYYLGTFATQEEAAKTYDSKAIELFGEFARRNFPREQYTS